MLDEADRLFEQGCADFTADLEVILEAVPARRQTLLFSATLTDTLSELKSLAMNKPFFWEAASEYVYSCSAGRQILFIFCYFVALLSLTTLVFPFLFSNLFFLVLCPPFPTGCGRWMSWTSVTCSYPKQSRTPTSSI